MTSHTTKPTASQSIYDVMPIDPELAAEILARPAENRPVAPSTVTRYAAAMLRGEWKVTPQGIMLAPDGALLDGQHRLAAVVESGCTVEMAVFFDVDPAVFAVLDTGRRRSAADTFSLSGERDAAVLASALRHLHLYLTYPDRMWTGTITTVSNLQLREMLEQHPEMRSAVDRGRRLANQIEMIPSAAALCVYLTERWGGQPASALADWYTGLSTGAGLDVDSPALALRETFRKLRDRTSLRRHRDTRAHAALYLRAWSAWADGEPIRRLQMPANMPRFGIPDAVAA